MASSVYHMIVVVVVDILKLHEFLGECHNAGFPLLPASHTPILIAIVIILLIIVGRIAVS